MNRIREKRKERGLTQKQLASLVNLDYTHVGRIETGERTLNVEYLPIFAKALNCEPWELLPFDMQPKTFLYCGSLNELKNIIKDMEQ